MDSHGNSPFATIVHQGFKTNHGPRGKRTIADKLPLTPSRLKPGPFAARTLSGAVGGGNL
jgi:hypothetical protein